MIKTSYFLAVFVTIFLSMAVIAPLYAKPGKNHEIKDSPICEKYIIKGRQISVKCAFPKSKDHISTIISGSFEFYGDTNTVTENDIDWIHLSKLIIMKNGKKSQEINIESTENNIRLSDFLNAVRLMDLNFDGYDDIQLLVLPTASVNAVYEYWLYNSDTQQFEHSDLRDKLFGFDVTPDPKTKTIFIQSHSGCCYNWETTYHWVANELRKKTELYYGAIVMSDACGQTITHYNDNEETISMDIESSGYCKGDEHNAPQTIEPYLTKLKNDEKNGGYVLKKNGNDKFTVIYNKPTK